MLVPCIYDPVFMLVRAVPKMFSIDFCSQNLQLSFEIAVESNRQMTSRGLNLDSNLNSASVKRVVKVLSALKTQNLNKWYGVLVLLRIVQISQNWGKQSDYFNAQAQLCRWMCWKNMQKYAKYIQHNTPSICLQFTNICINYAYIYTYIYIYMHNLTMCKDMHVYVFICQISNRWLSQLEMLS